MESKTSRALANSVKEKPASAYQSSGHKRIDRRRFLMGGASAAGAAVAMGAGGFSVSSAKAAIIPEEIPDWTRYLGDGVNTNPYGIPSEYEKNVVRRTVDWLTPTAESSVSFTPLHDMHGILTPNGLHFERHHGGVPEIDPGEHVLLLHGPVDRPLKFSLADLMRMPAVNRIHFVECAANSGMEWRGAQLNGVQYTHGMISSSEWTGVALSTLLREAGVRDAAKWILVEGADASGLSRSLPVKKALDDCIVAYAQNGEMLRPEQGYPLRLLVPGWEGNINVKWLRRLEVGDKPWHHREETSKYTDLMPTGKARQFTWEMEAKSVITSPCPEKPLLTKGYHTITGFAWSGAGKIKRVDVSVDGGRNWRQASLDGLVLSKSLTRFSLPWEWNGQPALLQSRVIDETGYTQPTIQQLRNVRGDWSIYHNNAIQTWHVKKDGVTENVQVG
ncbi:MAG: sulfite dehydrogenase [Rhodospirillales bacterium]|nr:sulfite dehydrogenase [Rhodospirillales bacterium]